MIDRVAVHGSAGACTLAGFLKNLINEREGELVGTKERRPSVEQMLDRIHKGFGQGNGATYKPFMNVRDVPSEGLSHMVRSSITNRTHHYLSLGEQGVHLLAEYSGKVLDVREQYALLPWSEMQTVAHKLGIKYPQIPYTKTPVVLTTDLLITLDGPQKKNLLAIAVKPKEKLKDPRVLEKLWLERFYWNRRGVKWLLHSEEPMRVKNLRFFEGGLNHRKELDLQATTTDCFMEAFNDYWTVERSFNEVCFLAAAALGIPDSDGPKLASTAVWEGKTGFDLDLRRLRHTAPIPMKAQKS